MNRDTFLKKYPDLDTYDKFIEKIVELHKTHIYHTNVNGIQLITDKIEEITKIKSKLEENITELIKFKNGFKDLDKYLIFKDSRYNETTNDIKKHSNMMSDLCESLRLSTIENEAVLPAISVVHEKRDLIKFLENSLRNQEEITLNAKIIHLVTTRNKPLNGIAKVDIMRNTYAEVIGKEVKANDNKNSQFIEQYKEYKRNQNKNQKENVVIPVEKPVDSANPSDGREGK